MIKNIGVIGLGNMGATIAKNLSRYYNVFGYDIKEERREKLNDTNIKCYTDVLDIALNTDTLILSLPNGNISIEIMKKIQKNLKKGQIIIETSTVLPEDILSINEICEQQSASVIDAAILGGVEQMSNSNVQFLVGGDKMKIEKIKSVLSRLGNDIIYMGKLGSGMSAKIINNSVAHTAMVLIVEASTIAKKYGINHENMMKILEGETAFKRPVNHRFNERIKNNNYDGGMSISNTVKDSNLILKLANQSNVPLFTIQSGHTVYEVAYNNEELREKDYASIATLWDKWC